jgi:hypothetical protein
MKLTEAQAAWMSAHPEYSFPGRPVHGSPMFADCGTLYVDGRFEPMAPMKVVRLEEGCRLVGRAILNQKGRGE